MTLRAFTFVSTARRSGAAFTLAVSGAVMLGAALVVAAGPVLAQAGGKSDVKSDGSTGKTDKVCASYGPGFQRVPGTDSCVRSGAAVRTDVYGGTGVSNAPNQFSGTGGTSLPSASDTAAPDPWKSAR